MATQRRALIASIHTAMEEDQTDILSKLSPYLSRELMLVPTLSGPVRELDFDYDMATMTADSGAASTHCMHSLQDLHPLTNLFSVGLPANDNSQAQVVLTHSPIQVLAASHSVLGFAQNVASQTELACDDADTYSFPDRDAKPTPSAESASGGRCASSPGSVLVPSLNESPRENLATNTETLGPGGFTNALHRKPSVKAPASINTTSSKIRSQADMLMNLAMQGGCGQPLLVPRVQQALTATTTTQEELPSIKVGMQGVTQGHSDSTGNKSKATKGKIPKRPHADYLSFLNATPEEIKKRALHVLRCKLCPEVNFTSWDHFSRHCKTAEAHPLQISFCDRCGDFFARPEVLKGHVTNRASECCDLSPDEVDAKRSETARIHQMYMAQMKERLKTNQWPENWRSFADVMKDRYPNSSKKGRK